MKSVQDAVGQPVRYLGHPEGTCMTSISALRMVRCPGDTHLRGRLRVRDRRDGYEDDVITGQA